MLFLALGTLAVVAVCGTLLANHLNRSRHLESAAARETVIRNFKESSSGNSIEAVLSKIGVSDEELGRGRQVLAVLARTLGVPSAAPPPSTTLASIFRVATQSSTTAPPNGPSQIEPFAADLVANLLEIADKAAWERRLLADDTFPRDDDALSDLLMSMTVEQFVKEFVPLVRTNKRQ
jgi:hypothetical protein